MKTIVLTAKATKPVLATVRSAMKSCMPSVVIDGYYNIPQTNPSTVIEDNTTVLCFGQLAFIAAEEISAQRKGINIVQFPPASRLTKAEKNREVIQEVASRLRNLNTLLAQSKQEEIEIPIEQIHLLSQDKIELLLAQKHSIYLTDKLGRSICVGEDVKKTADISITPQELLTIFIASKLLNIKEVSLVSTIKNSSD